MHYIIYTDGDTWFMKSDLSMMVVTEAGMERLQNDIKPKHLTDGEYLPVNQ